jgi:hydroxypyruvate reductase
MTGAVSTGDDGTVKPDILVLNRIYAPTVSALERDYRVHKLWLASDHGKLLREIGGRVRAVVTTSVTGFPREQFEEFPKLELIACFGIGHSAIDIAAATQRGVIVANTPDSISDSVADLALGLMIGVMRRICETDRFVRARKWTESLPPLGTDLSGKACGIVGFGKIGKAVADRVQVFGMSACYHGRRQKAGVGLDYYRDVEALARDSDCLVVTCPSTPETRGLIGGRVLKALGPTGYVINVARGPIVDEQALIAALKRQEIAGAALDVYWDEPNVPAELLEMDNVVLAPHIGSSTVEIREQRSAHLLENVSAFFAGRAVPHRLN